MLSDWGKERHFLSVCWWICILGCREKKETPWKILFFFCHVANALVWYAKLPLMKMFCSISLLPLLAAYSQAFSEREESSNVQSVSHFFIMSIRLQYLCEDFDNFQLTRHRCSWVTNFAGSLWAPTAAYNR